MNTIEKTEKPIIEACLQSTHDLLTHYWGDVCRIRDAKDNFVSVTVTFKVDTTGDSPVVKTRIGFSRRYGDTQEVTVDTAQTEFYFLKQLAVA